MSVFSICGISQVRSLRTSSSSRGFALASPGPEILTEFYPVVGHPCLKVLRKMYLDPFGKETNSRVFP